MKDSYIQRSIKRTNIRYLAFVLALAVISIVGLISNRFHFYNLLWGPFPLEASHLDDKSLIYTGENHDQYYFKITGEALYPLGELSYGISEQTVHTANYDMIKTGEGYLPVVSGKPIKSVEAKGFLLSLPSDIRGQIIAKMKAQGVNGNVGNVMLDTTGAFMQDIGAKLLFASALLIFTLINAVKLVIRVLDNKKHPLYKNLIEYGMPEAVMENVDEEFANKALVRENYRYILTPSWIIRKGPFIFKLSKNYLELKR